MPLTGITEAVFARSLSVTARPAPRRRRRARGPAARRSVRRDVAFVDDIRAALYASKVVAYAQGFEQMAAAARTYDWDLRWASWRRSGAAAASSAPAS